MRNLYFFLLFVLICSCNNNVKKKEPINHSPRTEKQTQLNNKDSLSISSLRKGSSHPSPDIDSLWVDVKMPYTPYDSFSINYQDDYLHVSKSVEINSEKIININSNHKYEGKLIRKTKYYGYDILYQFRVFKNINDTNHQARWFSLTLNKDSLSFIRDRESPFAFIQLANDLKLENYNTKYNKFILTTKSHHGYYYLIIDTVGTVEHIGSIFNRIEGGDLDSYFKLTDDSKYLITANEIYNFQSESNIKISSFSGNLKFNDFQFLDEINDFKNFFLDSKYVLSTRKLSNNRLLVIYIPEFIPDSNNIEIIDYEGHKIVKFHSAGLDAPVNRSIKIDFPELFSFNEDSSYFALFEEKEQNLQVVENIEPYNLRNIKLDQMSNKTFTDFKGDFHAFKIDTEFKAYFFQIDLKNNQFFYKTEEYELD